MNEKLTLSVWEDLIHNQRWEELRAKLAATHSSDIAEALVHGQCSRRIRRSFCRPAGLPKSLKSALGCPGPGNDLSKDMKGIAAFWPEAKYGKMRIEGPDPVNA
jgi:hypothetical protein